MADRKDTPKSGYRALDNCSTDRMLAVVPIEVRDAMTEETLEGFPLALYGGALVAGEMLRTTDGLREYEVIRVEQRLDRVILFVVLGVVGGQ